MALATEDDVEAALGRTLTRSEDVTTLLETASDLVVGYLGSTPDPVPSAVIRVVADMVAAVLNRPAVTTSQLGANGYNQIREDTVVRIDTEAATTTGPWLTKALKARLSPYRSGGMNSVPMVSDRTG